MLYIFHLPFVACYKIPFHSNFYHQNVSRICRWDKLDALILRKRLISREDICKKAQQLQVNSKTSSSPQEIRTLPSQASNSRQNTEANSIGLVSLSAPNGHLVPRAYAYGGHAFHVVDSDSNQHVTFVHGVPYHVLGSQNEVPSVFYQPMDVGNSQIFYIPAGAHIPSFSRNNYFYNPQYPHPGSTYQQAATLGCQYWSSPVEVPVRGFAIEGLKYLGIQNSGYSSGHNNLFSRQPEFQHHVMPANDLYCGGIFPAVVTNPVFVNPVVNGAVARWMEPRRRVKGYIKNHLSSGAYSTAGNAGPSVVFPFPQHRQAVYSSHATPGIYPPIGSAFGISVTSERRRTNDGLISNQRERLNDNQGFFEDNIRQLVNYASLDNGLGAPSSSNDANQSQTARSRSHWMTVNRQARGLSENRGKVDEIVSFLVDNDSYNRSDFVTQYDDAKFFVIKSYSEDDIHKSIKYNVWASTPLGNQKLNEAYYDAQKRAGDKPGSCPIFLFFSVNGSRQFCGLAEMVGPVDFSKSMDFWQPGKWNGNFSVRWHIIKDTYNSQLCHIILENNDSKPVTNSRDVQEISLPQGLEMLNIFKNCLSRSCILENFYLYESRQRTLQDKYARQQAQLQLLQSGEASTSQPLKGSTKESSFESGFAEASSKLPQKSSSKPESKEGGGMEVE